MSRHHGEIVQRLKIAQERTREAYEHTFKGHDLHPGTDIAGAWPFITAAYSGIEQAFKFHIAQANGKNRRGTGGDARARGGEGRGALPLSAPQSGQALPAPGGVDPGAAGRAVSPVQDAPSIHRPGDGGRIPEGRLGGGRPRLRAVAVLVDGAGEEDPDETAPKPCCRSGTLRCSCARPSARDGDCGACTSISPKASRGNSKRSWRHSTWSGWRAETRTTTFAVSRRSG